MHVKRQSERGQVLPMWIVGVIATFSLMMMALNYGNAIRWQIRAQNAADSAAAAVVSIQAQRWNLMMATLYASGVEEYRIRKLLDGMLLATNASGGCLFAVSQNDPNYNSGSAPYCNKTYMDLHDAYQRAVNRYGMDAKYLNDVATLATFSKFQADASSLLTTLQDPTCQTSQPSPAPTTGPTPAATPTANSGFKKPTCGDYVFKYTFAPVNHPVNGINGMEYRTNLNSVAADAQIFQVQYGQHNAVIAQNLFAPVQVDLVTCALVPPIVPNFGPFHFAPYYAIGRAASADVMVEQDWLQPGSIVDHTRPGGDSLFQPAENYTTSGTPGSGASNYNWYNVDFAGEQNRAYQKPLVFSYPVYNDQFDARTGWWGAIPIKPFGKTVSVQTAC